MGNKWRMYWVLIMSINEVGFSTGFAIAVEIEIGGGAEVAVAVLKPHMEDCCGIEEISVYIRFISIKVVKF